MPTPLQRRDFPFFFSLPSSEGETHSYLRRTPFPITIGSLLCLCVRKRLAMKTLCLFKYDFCFLTTLTDVFVWCGGWDPTAFTWQPGNQSFRVAIATRVGEGRSPFYHSRLCPFPEAYRIFRKRSFWIQQQQQTTPPPINASWHQGSCAPASQSSL